MTTFHRFSFATRVPVGVTGVTTCTGILCILQSAIADRQEAISGPHAEVA